MASSESQNSEESVTQAVPIPGPTAWPFVGNVLSLDKNHMQRTLYQWMKEYGPVFKFSFLGEEVVVLNDTKLMREAFAVIRDRPVLWQSGVNFNHGGAAFANYDGNMKLVKEITWKAYKETFKDPVIEKIQDKILNDFIEHLISQKDGILDVDDTVLRSIAAQYCAESIGCQPSQDLIDAAVTFLLDTGMSLFGYGRPFILTKYPWLTSIPGSLKNTLQRGANNMTRLVEIMIGEAKNSYKKGDEHGIIQTFLTRQSEENAKAGSDIITEDNLNASVVTETILLAYAGTTRAISTFFLQMQLNPEPLAKVREEIKRIREQKVMEDIVEDDAPYLCASITENMRLSTCVFVTIPHKVKHDQSIGGYQFKTDQTVIGCASNAHWSESVWGDPFTFRPERFLDTSGKLLPEDHPLQQAFVAFGVGSRYCNGKYSAMSKIFKYISRVLYRCDIEKVEGQTLPTGDPLDFNSVVALAPQKFSCKFIARD